MNRRNFLKKVGIGGAVALAVPVVVMAFAPKKLPIIYGTGGELEPGSDHFRKMWSLDSDGKVSWHEMMIKEYNKTYDAKEIEYRKWLERKELMKCFENNI